MEYRSVLGIFSLRKEGDAYIFKLKVLSEEERTNNYFAEKANALLPSHQPCYWFAASEAMRLIPYEFPPGTSFPKEDESGFYVVAERIRLYQTSLPVYIPPVEADQIGEHIDMALTSFVSAELIYFPVASFPLELPELPGGMEILPAQYKDTLSGEIYMSLPENLYERTLTLASVHQTLNHTMALSISGAYWPPEDELHFQHIMLHYEEFKCGPGHSHYWDGNSQWTIIGAATGDNPFSIHYEWGGQLSELKMEYLGSDTPTLIFPSPGGGERGGGAPLIRVAGILNLPGIGGILHFFGIDLGAPASIFPSEPYYVLFFGRERQALFQANPVVFQPFIED
jgi:hypothetical protein